MVRTESRSRKESVWQLMVQQDTTMSTSGEEGVAVAAFCAQHGRQGGLREGVLDWAQYAEVERAAGIAL